MVAPGIDSVWQLNIPQGLCVGIAIPCLVLKVIRAAS